jgi:UDP-2,3-diacylglucosamine hydrolase
MAEAGAATPPAFDEWTAGAGWQAIDFLSDLHLSPALPRTFAAFARHLQATPADAVVILGDLFEVWIGDDARTLDFERRCVDVLAAAGTRRTLAFMVGNRDFLLGEAMLGASRMKGLRDPTLLLAFGRRIVLSHGDALCLDDTEYQDFRRLVRSPGWQREFLAKPLAERAAIAAQIRARSEQRRAFDGRADVDVDPGAAAAWLRAAGAAELVHGHTHRPALHALPGGGTRHVLSDWDLDDPVHARADVLRLTRAGFERLNLAH